MTKLSRDLSGGILTTLNPRENLYVSGTLGAVNAEVITDADGAPTVFVDLRGTFSLTFVIEGTVDGTNWMAIPFRPATTNGIWVLSQAGTTGGIWQAVCSGFRKVRVRCSAYTSGSATAVIVADISPLDIVAIHKASDQAGTITGTSGAGVTLTMTAPAAGLFIHINRIILQRFAVATLTAAATPVLVTTTNIPGTRVFSVPADAAPIGAVYSEIVGPSLPLRASAAATAVTIVCPATTNTIWRVTADWYNAP
jgi:hypothetical protein